MNRELTQMQRVSVAARIKTMFDFSGLVSLHASSVCSYYLFFLSEGYEG